LGLEEGRGNGSEEDYITGSFMICPHQILVMKPYRMRWGEGVWQRMGERKVHVGAWWGKPE